MLPPAFKIPVFIIFISLLDLFLIYTAELSSFAVVDIVPLFSITGLSVMYLSVIDAKTPYADFSVSTFIKLLFVTLALPSNFTPLTKPMFSSVFFTIISPYKLFFKIFS